MKVISGILTFFKYLLKSSLIMQIGSRESYVTYLNEQFCQKNPSLAESDTRMECYSGPTTRVNLIMAKKGR